MPLTQMEHYLVLTDDIEVTRDFYCGALGLHVGPRPPLAFRGYWVYLGDTPCIHIAERTSYTAHSLAEAIPVSGPAPGTGPFDHIAFNAQDYDAVLARLRQHGVTVVCNDPPGAPVRQMFFKDPNGLKVEINFRKAPTEAG
jgi:catechol 2,3-dioxygenase-like lactoylglutathione lyase family enzyme